MASISARFIGWHNNIVRDIIFEFIKRYLVHTENVGVVENYIGNVPTWILFVCVVIISPVLKNYYSEGAVGRIASMARFTAILISSMLLVSLHANLQFFIYHFME